MFSNPFLNAFGLDIGDLSLKVVWLRNRSLWHRSLAFELVTARSIDLPPGLIVNGEIQQFEQVRKYFHHLLRGPSKRYRPIKSPWVVATLPETQSFIKLIHLNKPADDILEADILTAAQKHIPFDEEAAYLDWQIMPNQAAGKEQTNVLIGAIPKIIADSYLQLLESFGLGVVALEIEALALARSMITARKPYEGEARAILDLGATRSSLIIYDHEMVQFSTSLPYSGELITTAIAQKIHLPYEEAEGWKKNVGLDVKQDKKGVWQIITTLTAQLITDIEKAIAFYYSHFPQVNKITHITMCGGGAAMPRLDRVLSAKLKISARPGKPWKNLFTRQPIAIDEKTSLGYATAIGLALRAAENPFFLHDIL